ncbi:MAG: ComEA family DNA-binding protein [Burkholderiales bacterium]|nr:ComEA family DNA-binding protein [Burkholderiales bacterium]MDR4516728.1 ComEA family DNA-binding protein [Nitrosomonas sp.]
MKKIIMLVVLLFAFTGSAFAVVNVNTATQAELEVLQGIGPAKAKAIIEYREKHGLFTSIEGLIEVDGIGPGTMKQLRESITVGNALNSETTAAMATQ